MTAATMTTAKVKYAAREPRQTSRGPRINVVVITDDGDEVTLWGDPGDADLTPLKKGQQVDLLFDGKGHKLVKTGQQQPQGHATPEDSEEAFNALLTRCASRMDRAITAASTVAAKKLGITAELVRTDLAAAAIVKEMAVSMFIESHKAMSR